MSGLKSTQDLSNASRLIFGSVVVDRSDFTVFRADQKQPLAPLAFDVLLYLIQHRERVVSKEELFAEIWKDRFVSDNALTRTIADIRHALGDRSDAPQYIATVPKRGYRFIAELIEPADHRATAKAVVEVNSSALVQQPTRVKLFSLVTTHRSVAQILIICVFVLGGLGAYVLRKASNTGSVYNPDAHALYLKGRERIETMDPGEIEKGGEYFRQAISLAPNYALAHAGMADYYIHAKRRNDPDFYMSRARESAERALTLDDTVAEAHAAMGRIIELYDWDLPRAEKEIKRALELDPQSQSTLVRQTWINHLALQGRGAEALTEGRKALERDPLNVRLNLTVGWILYSTRQYQEAAVWFQKMIRSGVYVPGSYSWLAQVYAAEGRLDSAVEADLRYRVMSGTKPEAILALKNAFAKSGWKGYLQEVLEQRTRNQGYVEPYVFATIYARLGEKGLALSWLEKSARDRSLFMTRVSTDPTFDGLHSEPRFQDLLRRVGLSRKPHQG